MTLLRQLSISLGAVVLCLLWHGLPPVEARCGLPDLPFMAQLTNGQFENWGFFEEAQRVKVICEAGLIGHLEPPTSGSNYSAEENFMSIDSSVWIECQNSRWNTTGLQCLNKVDLTARNVQVKWKEIERARSVEPLVDNDALSCLDLDLDRASEQQDESVLFSMRLDSSHGRIPRVVLMVKSTEDGRRHHANLTLLEDLISEMNQASNASDSVEGDVEVEEAKRFLDFVYETEFRNHSAGAPVKMMLLGEDESSDRKHKVIRTARHEIKFSVLLGSNNNADLRQQNAQECYFNEDAAIAVGRSNSSTTELLIFDCHLSAANELASGDNNAHEVEDSQSFIWVRLDISKLNDPNQTVSSETPARSLIQLCGLEVFAVAEGQCGKPYVPIYGMVSKTKLADNVTSAAQYGCMSGYRAINLTNEHEGQLSEIGVTPRSTRQVPLLRVCDRATDKWLPQAEDIFCVPVNSCRHPPPLPDAKKFYFEYSKLDNLKRALSGTSMATLRCQMLTDYVMPYTIYGCDKSGQWTKLGKNDTTEPRCRTSLNRNLRKGKPSHYYHHYYHYYKDNEPTNRTAVIIFGRQINDNKYLIYYGAAGLVVLFGGSFIILFHVRRMAKKISRQMRERSYMAAEKGVSDSFLPVTGMDGGNLPPYYNNNDNFYDVNTLFSNDLPPPATPISMPSSGLEKEFKDKNNLSSNFDSIKF